MDIHYYQANSHFEAFELASKDTKNWGFREMDALTEMAQLLRNGYMPQKEGMATSCFSSRGWFNLFSSDAKGYGIGLVSLQGHEAGIDDLAAQEVLEHHREHRDQEMYAGSLLIFAEYISSIKDLDAAYEKLLAAKLMVKLNKTVTVANGDKKFRRPAYRIP